MLPKTDPRGRPRIPEAVTAEVLKLRESGASIMDIARTLGIGVGSVHRAIVADIKTDPPSQSTGEAGVPSSEAGHGNGDTPDSSTASPTKATLGGSSNE